MSRLSTKQRRAALRRKPARIYWAGNISCANSRGSSALRDALRAEFMAAYPHPIVTVPIPETNAVVRWLRRNPLEA